MILLLLAAVVKTVGSGAHCNGLHFRTALILRRGGSVSALPFWGYI
jgi:hypothetical protein